MGLISDQGPVWSVAQRGFHGGRHVQQPGISFHLTNGKGKVAHSQPWVPPLFAVGAGPTPILDQEQRCLSSWIGEVGGVKRHQNRICRNSVIEAINEVEEEPVSSNDVVERDRTISGLGITRLVRHDPDHMACGFPGNAAPLPWVSPSMVLLVSPSATDPQALFEEHVVPQLEVLYRTARSITRNQVDAEDLVQETLLRAFGAIDRFDGRYPKAWLLTIMRNANINRARKKVPDLLDDPELTFERSTRFAETDTPEQVVVEPVFDATVHSAFNRLPESFKQVVELVDLQGLAYQESADLLDIPVGTVMSRLHRARKRIRTEIAEYGLDSERTPT